MSQSTVMNAVLYRRLSSRFGDPKIRNAGQARVAFVRRDLEDKPTTRVKQWGEQYVTRCPICKGDALAVSYMYGQPDDSGRPMLHLAHCHGRNCLKKYENRVALAERLGAGDGILEHARVLPGKLLSEEERTPELPASRTRLDRLPKGHPAGRWLKRQGFDPDRLARFYDLSYCEDSEDPLTRERIIIPVALRGKHQGWQSLGMDQTHAKYLSARGMAASTLIYNLDKAREYATPVIVQEPMDVWAFGRMAVCPLGASVSAKQVATLMAVFSDRRVVLLARERTENALARRLTLASLERAFPGNLLVVAAPADVPPGAKGRAELRNLVAEEARKRGFSVRFAREN